MIGGCVIVVVPRFGTCSKVSLRGTLSAFDIFWTLQLLRLSGRRCQTKLFSSIHDIVDPKSRDGTVSIPFQVQGRHMFGSCVNRSTAEVKPTRLTFESGPKALHQRKQSTPPRGPIVQ